MLSWWRSDKMEWLTKLSFGLLALIHLSPSLAAFSSSLREKLYGVLDADTALLMSHRGMLFLAINVLCILAIFLPDYRKAALIALSISMIGFLVLYAFGGFPTGALRKIAIADAIGLIPLTFLIYTVWFK